MHKEYVLKDDLDEETWKIEDDSLSNENEEVKMEVIGEFLC